WRDSTPPSAFSMEWIPMNSPSPNVHPLGVLVVDDDAGTVDSLTLLLKHWGHEVRAAHTGRDAVSLTQHWRPDVALLDMAMPGMDGLHLARLLRSQPGLKNLKLVALTGVAVDSYQKQAQEEGFTYYLLKPADAGSLRQLLEALV